MWSMTPINCCGASFCFYLRTLPLFFSLLFIHFRPLESRYVCLSLAEAAFVLHVHHPLGTSVIPCTNNLHKHGGLKRPDARQAESVHTLAVKDDEPWLSVVCLCVCSGLKEIRHAPFPTHTHTHTLLCSHAFVFSSAFLSVYLFDSMIGCDASTKKKAQY